MSTAIFWFRQDLRCDDNPALALACKNHQKLILVYVKEPNPVLPMGSAQQWWLFHSLQSLKNKLKRVQLDLHFLEGDPLYLFKDLIAKHSVQVIYWNRCYEPAHIHRDQLIKEGLKRCGVQTVSCNSSLLNEPWEVLNQSGSYFKVFTPYWQQCLRQFEVKPIQQINKWPENLVIQSSSLEHWNLIPKQPDWAYEFSKYWQPGEEGAQRKLHNFFASHLQRYNELRNAPALSWTSKLSPHLHFGEMSSQQIWISVQEAMQQPGCDLMSAQKFLTELGWREFSYYLLYHYPNLTDTNFNRTFDYFPWQDNDSALQCWQHGLTGYPIVDAGMRELWRTGYMHNRVRMIVASFLTKDLMIDWRKGASWFWDTLLDADLANNCMNWQWVAGCGPDAAPYYRVFNPILQGEKFDPEGEYVRHWLPELTSVSNEWIHKPWLAPQSSLSLILGKDYPLPIVEHSSARKIALAAYQGLKASARSANQKENYKNKT